MSSHKSRAIAGAALFAVLGAGCNGEKAVAPTLAAPDATLASIRPDAENVIIAVGGAHQVSVTGLSLTGAPITAFDSVRYVLVSITDTIRVALSEGGMVTGRASSGSNPVRLNVFAYKNGVGKGDQVIIQVTNTALVNPTLSIQPVPPDSARLDQARNKTLVPAVREADGSASVADVRMRLSTRGADAQRMRGYVPTNLRLPGADGTPLTPNVSASFNQIRSLAGEGTAWVHAEVNAYGIMLRDSVLFTLRYPSAESITIFTSSGLTIIVGFGRSQVWVSPGARITFSGGVGLAGGIQPPVTYVFEDPSAAGPASPPSTIGGASGNVVEVSGSQQSARVFATAGTYRWTATIGGNYPPLSGQSVSGVIYVK